MQSQFFWNWNVCAHLSGNAFAEIRIWPIRLMDRIDKIEYQYNANMFSKNKYKYVYIEMIGLSKQFIREMITLNEPYKNAYEILFVFFFAFVEQKPCRDCFGCVSTPQSIYLN